MGRLMALEFHPDNCISMATNNQVLEKDTAVIVDDQLKFEYHMKK